MTKDQRIAATSKLSRYTMERALREFLKHEKAAAASMPVLDHAYDLAHLALAALRAASGTAKQEPAAEVWAVYSRKKLHAVELTQDKARHRRDLMCNAQDVTVERAMLAAVDKK